MSHDHEIIDVLDQLEPADYTGTLWRTTWVKRDPLLGGTGGGRWSPHKKFEALYTSLEEDISIAELHYHLSQAPVRSSCAMFICELEATNLNLLELTSSSVLSDLKLEERPHEVAAIQSQKVGAAAYFLGYQGVLVPSYRADGINCVVFTERTNLEQIKVKTKQEINWPAWIKISKL